MTICAYTYLNFFGSLLGGLNVKYTEEQCCGAGLFSVGSGSGFPVQPRLVQYCKGNMKASFKEFYLRFFKFEVSVFFIFIF